MNESQTLPFIVVDGADGAGKTTLVRALSRRILDLGMTPRPLRNPAGSSIGSALRTIVTQHRNLHPDVELLLMVAAQKQLIFEQLIPALRAGHLPIVDRYTLSTLVYQCLAPKRDLPAFCSRFKELMQDVILPNATIVLHASPQTLLARLDERKQKEAAAQASGNLRPRASKKKVATKKKVADAAEPADRFEELAFLESVAMGFHQCGSWPTGGTLIQVQTEGATEAEVFEAVWGLLLEHFPVLAQAAQGQHRQATGTYLDQF